MQISDKLINKIKNTYERLENKGSFKNIKQFSYNSFLWQFMSNSPKNNEHINVLKSHNFLKEQISSYSSIENLSQKYIVKKIIKNLFCNNYIPESLTSNLNKDSMY